MQNVCFTTWYFLKYCALLICYVFITAMAIGYFKSDMKHTNYIALLDSNFNFSAL